MAKFLNLLMLMVLVVMTHAQSGKTSGAATESTKIGYINIDSVLINLKDYPTQVKILEAFQKKLTADFEVKSLEFEQKYKEYQENEKKYSEEERKKKFTELQNLDQELSKLRNDANNQIAQKERDLLIPLNEKILKAIETVAKARGFSHITDRKNFYFASPAFDITKQVIEEANKL
jgi:outer membrane protein